MAKRTPSNDQLDELVDALREAGGMLRAPSGSKARTSYDEAADAIFCLRRDLVQLAETVVVRAEDLQRGDTVVFPGQRYLPIHSVRVADDMVDVAWDGVNAPVRVPVGRECRRELRRGEGGAA